MDRNHQLNAPDNESLKDIEQITDRSDLSSLYFTAHKEWEGKGLLSENEREAKRSKEQLAITLAARKKFILIGLLIPTPIILLVIIISLAAAYLNADNFKSLLVAAIGAVGVWLVVSFISIRRTYALFYNHALSATPFIVVFMVLLGLSTQAVYLLTRPLHTESAINNTLIVCAGAYLASIVISGALISIWVSPRLSSRAKIGAIGLLAALILVLITICIL